MSSHSKEEVKVVRAGESEIEYVTTLFDQYRIFYHQASNVIKAREFIKERIEQKESVIFLAYHEQDPMKIPLGFVQLYPSFSSVSMKRLWVLNDLFVAEVARNRGVAKRLIDQAKHFAIETKAKGLTLSTAVSNSSAQRLYESLGYEKDEEFLTYNLVLNNTNI